MLQAPAAAKVQNIYTIMPSLSLVMAVSKQGQHSHASSHSPFRSRGGDGEGLFEPASSRSCQGHASKNLVPSRSCLIEWKSKGRMMPSNQPLTICIIALGQLIDNSPFLWLPQPGFYMYQCTHPVQPATAVPAYSALKNRTSNNCQYHFTLPLKCAIQQYVMIKLNM